MADLRALAEHHPELLTRECEREHLANRALDACPECDGTGRRLLTLEEALEALIECGIDEIDLGAWSDGVKAPRRYMRPGYDSRERAGVQMADSLAEAAYRLLIELEVGRG